MAFKQRSTAILLAATIVASVAYAVLLAFVADGNAVEDIPYQPLTFVAVVLMVIVTAVGHVIIAIAEPGEANAPDDERDRLIEMRGDQVGAYVLAAAAVFGIGLAMIEAHWFWIANVLLAGFVLSEVVKWTLMLVRYRRGF